MNIKTFLCVTTALVLMIRKTFSAADNSDKKFHMNNDQQASHELLGCDAAKVAEEAGRHLGETIMDQFLRHSKVNLKNLTLPFLPLISVYQVSLAMTNVQILGLEKFTLNVDVLGNKNKSFTLTFPQLTLLADYVAGGHVNDLPFVGESTLNATLIEPSAQVWYWQKPGTRFCALENSTVYQLNIASMDINFDDLNPGQDSGQLINTMLNAYAKDLAFLLTMALNDETKLHPKVDNIVVKIINNKCPMYHSYLAKTLLSIQDEIKLGELRSKIAAPVSEPETKFQRKIQVDSNDNVHDFYFTKKEFSADLIENLVDVEQELKFRIEEASKEIEEPHALNAKNMGKLYEEEGFMDFDYSSKSELKGKIGLANCIKSTLGVFTRGKSERVDAVSSEAGPDADPQSTDDDTELQSPADDARVHRIFGDMRSDLQNIFTELVSLVNRKARS